MVAESSLQQVLQNLEQIGFYDVALPFLLIFTLIFAILQKLKIFGQNAKNFNLIIAVIMAFLVVRSQPIVQTMNIFLPKISFIALIFIMFLLLIGVLMGPAETGWSGIPLLFGVIVTIIALVVTFYGSAAPLGITVPSWIQMSKSDFYLFLGIFIFFVAIAWITAEPKQGESAFTKFLKELPNEFGRGGTRP